MASWCEIVHDTFVFLLREVDGALELRRSNMRRDWYETKNLPCQNYGRQCDTCWTNKTGFFSKKKDNDDIAIATITIYAYQT